MQATGRKNAPRRGFTLIELLVVIAIIATLASLILSGTMAIRGSGPRLQARSEISNIDGAISQYKTDMHQVEYIPSDFILREDFYDTSPTTNPGSYQAHLKAVGYLTNFGRAWYQQGAVAGRVNCGATGAGIDWNGNGSIQAGNIRLSGEQCLVFFLGGIPSTAGGNSCLGFSKNPENPAAAGGKRNGPYYAFKSVRLADGGSGFFVYRDPYVRPTGAVVNYAYFSGNKGGVYEANSAVATYYRDSAGAPISPKGYQILCAGLDGVFGSTPTTPGVLTSGSVSTATGKDDQANFTPGLLGTGAN